MVFVYHSSDAFAPVLATSMASIFENNKSVDVIEVYVFETEISDANKKRLYELTRRYKRKIIFIPMPDINNALQLGLKDVGKKGWFFNSYCKLFLDELLPNEIDRVIYLDSDVLVVDDLTTLWNLDMKDKCAAAVIDCLGEKYYSLLGLNEKTKYCNSGIILENLKEWRQQRIGDRIRNYIKENGGYVYFMEQTAFNGGLQEDILILHPKYNVYTMMKCLDYDEIMKLRKVERFYSKKEIDEAVANPSIIHLTNTFLLANRAWYENSSHPDYLTYQHYKKLTPWCNDSDFIDKRSVKDKLIQLFVDILPKCLVLKIASLLYNYVRVYMIKQQMMKYSNNRNKGKII